MCFKTRVGTGDVIQGNRIMWLCRACFKARIQVDGYAGYVLRLG